MANLLEDIQCVDSDTRPPMLNRTNFASWQQWIRLYCLGKDNGVNILKSIDEGPFRMGTLRETLAEGTEGALHLGPERPRVYSDLTSEEKDRINKKDRESKLYDDFEHFRQHKGETIHDYYVWFAKLINDMRNIKMTMFMMQLNSKFINNMLLEWGRFVTAVKLNRELRDFNYDQLYAYLKQHEGRQNRGQGNSARGAGASGYGRASNRVGYANPGRQDNIVDEDVDEQPVQDLALNVDNVFQVDDCDTFDSDKMRIEQYFLVTDYLLWEVILNGDSPAPTRIIEGVVQPVAPTSSSSESLDQIHDRLQKLISQLEILGESLSQEEINFKFLRSLPTEWRTHTFIWRNKTDLEEQSLDDLFNILKIYKDEVKSSSSASTSTQNIAFVSSQTTDSTNESVSVVASVSAASAKTLVSALLNMDTLSNAMAMLTVRARRFLQRTGRNLGANGPTSMGFDMSKVECYNCHMKGHFARECRSPKDTRRNVAAKPQRRNVPVETSTSNALVSQCDGVASYNWSFQAEKEPTNYALMAFTSLSSSSFDKEVASCSKTCTKAYVTFSETGESLSASPIYARYQSGEGYHVVPPPYTGTFIPPKPDLVFHDAPNVNETVHTAFNVELSPTKPDKALSHRPLAPLIKDWISDSEDDPKSELPQNTPRPPFQSLKAIEIAGIERHALCRHVVPTAVLTKSKLVPLPAARQVTSVVSPNNVTRSAQPKLLSLSSIHHLEGTLIGNLQHALKDKGVIDSRCSRHMTGNMPYWSDFEEINGRYVTFGDNLKGGKMSGKGKIRTGKLDFDDVYFVKELKFNLFSVSQMCDKKNSVLFTNTECIVLSLEFKLPNETQVLLRVPRENNMYNVNLKNIVPSGDLTCLFAKATLDESTLWHRRLGHIKFKIMNKLVKDPLSKFDAKANEGFLVRYSVSSKAFRVFNSRTRIVQETLHINFMENKPNVAGSGPTWLFDIDNLTQSMNYQPVTASNQSNPSAGFQEQFGKKPEFEGDKPESEFYVSPSSKFEDFFDNSINEVNAVGTLVPTVGQISTNNTNTFSVVGPSNTVVNPTHGKSSYIDSSQYPDDPNMLALEDITYFDDEEYVGAGADFADLETNIAVVLTARRLEMPLPGVCTAIEEMMKKLSVKDRWQLH
nr:ribonuclease H-like domain-containing protein [Tanacetum cinerariifolium]